MITIIALVVIGLVIAGLVYAYRPGRVIVGWGVGVLSLVLAAWIYFKFIAPD